MFSQASVILCTGVWGGYPWSQVPLGVGSGYAWSQVTSQGWACPGGHILGALVYQGRGYTRGAGIPEREGAGIPEREGAGIPEREGEGIVEGRGGHTRW